MLHDAAMTQDIPTPSTGGTAATPSLRLRLTRDAQGFGAGVWGTASAAYAGARDYFTRNWPRRGFRRLTYAIGTLLVGVVLTPIIDMCPLTQTFVYPSVLHILGPE